MPAIIDRLAQYPQKQEIHFMRHYDASSAHQRYGSNLASLDCKLGTASDPAELRSVIAGFLHQTQQIALHNKSLLERLSNSNDVIRGLRENLADVRREAMTDGLTGVANRKQFDISLRET